MDGDASRIDGRNARRGDDDHALGGMFTHIFQKGSLARSCLSRQKYADACMLNEVPSLAEFLIECHDDNEWLRLPSCKDTTILNCGKDEGDIFFLWLLCCP